MPKKIFLTAPSFKNTLKIILIASIIGISFMAIISFVNFNPRNEKSRTLNASEFRALESNMNNLIRTNLLYYMPVVDIKDYAVPGCGFRPYWYPFINLEENGSTFTDPIGRVYFESVGIQVYIRDKISAIVNVEMTTGSIIILENINIVEIYSNFQKINDKWTVTGTFIDKLVKTNFVIIPYNGSDSIHSGPNSGSNARTDWEFFKRVIMCPLDVIDLNWFVDQPDLYEITRIKST